MYTDQYTKQLVPHTKVTAWCAPVISDSQFNDFVDSLFTRWRPVTGDRVWFVL